MELIKQFEGHTITIVGTPEQPWFKGKDIALALDYKNTRDAIINNVREKNRNSFEKIGIRESSPTTPSIDKQTIFLNEAGLYELIIKSKNKNAIKFQDWIFEEVLPSIRKTGQYQMRPPSPQQHSVLIQNIKLLQDLGMDSRDRIFVKDALRNEIKLLTNAPSEKCCTVSGRIQQYFNIVDRNIQNKASTYGVKMKRMYIDRHGCPPEQIEQSVNGIPTMVNVYNESEWNEWGDDFIAGEIEKYYCS